MRKTKLNEQNSFLSVTTEILGYQTSKDPFLLQINCQWDDLSVKEIARLDESFLAIEEQTLLEFM